MIGIAGSVSLDPAIPGDDRIQVDADARLDAPPGAGPADERIRDAYLAWGDDGVDRLLGDFAFVLRDGRRRRLLAARDPLGVRPLHYHVSRERLTYATRVEDLFAMGVPRVLDEARIADALVPELEGIDRTSTFFHGVFRLPPGHRLVVESGRVSIGPTWTPDPGREIRLADDREYAELFLATFREAVRCRLDADTASMLSGGLDSSAIVGVARTLGRLTTVSAMDRVESDFIEAVIAEGGVSPIRVTRDRARELSGAIDGFLATSAEPFDAGMIVPVLMYAAARDAGARSVLDGVDGDTVVSLEPDYIDALLRRGRWGAAVREARGIARFYRGSHAPWSDPGRLLARGARRAILPLGGHVLLRRMTRRAAHARSLLGSVIHPDLVRRARVSERLDALAEHRPPGRSIDPRGRQARELTHPYLAAALERYHRAAASQGMEARHPFLDRRLVELCLALPGEQKARDGWSKWILRRSMEGLLPDAVRWRRGRWAEVGPAFLEDAIASRLDTLEASTADTMSALEPYVALPAWRELVARFRAERDPSDGAMVWRVVHLARWLRTKAASGYDAAARRVGAVAPSPSTPRGSRATTVAIEHDQSA